MQKGYVEVFMHSCLGVLNQKLFWDKYSSEKTKDDNGIYQNAAEEKFNLNSNWCQPLGRDEKTYDG